ncbi:hypothetical protein M501DRAFT_1000070 [Patellaria atrata CBS 101060]|uniref:Uncharacterized protein n=1 Tax=Patellaria atrata CBS 101060 TaxID=1346257 RepID=A0A9P4S372_9PEZI|nr:hypothetical protein M501DRAFT_1000070 [Patellaria atrata CBS 101060]
MYTIPRRPLPETAQRGMRPVYQPYRTSFGSQAHTSHTQLLKRATLEHGASYGPDQAPATPQLYHSNSDIAIGGNLYGREVTRTGSFPIIPPYPCTKEELDQAEKLRLSRRFSDMSVCGPSVPSVLHPSYSEPSIKRHDTRVPIPPPQSSDNFISPLPRVVSYDASRQANTSSEYAKRQMSMESFTTVRSATTSTSEVQHPDSAQLLQRGTLISNATMGIGYLAPSPVEVAPGPAQHVQPSPPKVTPIPVTNAIMNERVHRRDQQRTAVFSPISVDGAPRPVSRIVLQPPRVPVISGFVDISASVGLASGTNIRPSPGSATAAVRRGGFRKSNAEFHQFLNRNQIGDPGGMHKDERDFSRKKNWTVRDYALDFIDKWIFCRR